MARAQTKRAASIEAAFCFSIRDNLRSLLAAHSDLPDLVQLFGQSVSERTFKSKLIDQVFRFLAQLFGHIRVGE